MPAFPGISFFGGDLKITFRIHFELFNAFLLCRTKKKCEICTR